MNWEPPSSIRQWEKVLVEYYLQIGTNGDASPIRSFEITPATLALACGAPKDSLELIEEGLRKTLSSDRFLNSSLREGQRLRSTDELPNYFIYLALTLFIDSLLDGEYAEQGQFRNKLATWLRTKETFSQLRGVALMWEELVGWLEARVSKGDPYRQLILPEIPPTWTHIGYTRRLSFPSRSDLRFLQRFFEISEVPLDKPAEVVRNLNSFIERRDVSWGLRTAFDEFAYAYKSGEATTDHRFWELVRRAYRDDEAQASIESSIIITYDQDRDRIFICKYEEEQSVVVCALSQAVTICSEKKSHNLGPGIEKGLLFFRQVGTGRWQAESTLEKVSGRILLGVSAANNQKLQSILPGLKPSGEWFLCQEPIGVSVIETALQKVRLRAVPESGFIDVTIVDGILSDGAYLGRSRYLPRVESNIDNLQIIRLSGQGDSSEIRIHEGQLTTEDDIDGRYRITAGAAGSWRRVITFVRDAAPHLCLEGVSYNLDRLDDWSDLKQDSPTTNTFGDMGWNGESALADDLAEAVYARSISGISEADLIPIIERGLEQYANPYEILRLLHDAGFIEPRLRRHWRGRIWTLVPPSITPLSTGGETVVIVNGGLCKRLELEFKQVATSIGGVPFRQCSPLSFSLPVVGARNVDPAMLAKRLEWDIYALCDVPGLTPLAVEKTRRVGQGYILGSTWNWELGRFSNDGPGETDVKLTRWIHPGSRDHDLYRIEIRGFPSTVHLSRTAAILSAYSAANRTMFLFTGNNLTRVIKDGGLPTILAAVLRRRHLNNAGLQGGTYCYPASQSDAIELARLLPNCIGGVALPKKSISPIEAIMSVRHSGKRNRLKWIDGQLVS